MRLPFVSRERFDDERARCLKLEAELERLRELLIPGLRASTPTPEPAQPPPLILTEGTDFSQVTPIAGRPTIAFISGKANLAAAERARVPGAKGIAQELAEARRAPVVPKVTEPAKAVNGD